MGPGRSPLLRSGRRRDWRPRTGLVTRLGVLTGAAVHCRPLNGAVAAVGNCDPPVQGGSLTHAAPSAQRWRTGATMLRA